MGEGTISSGRVPGVKVLRCEGDFSDAVGSTLRKRVEEELSLPGALVVVSLADATVDAEMLRRLMRPGVAIVGSASLGGLLGGMLGDAERSRDFPIFESIQLAVEFLKAKPQA